MLLVSLAKPGAALAGDLITPHAACQAGVVETRLESLYQALHPRAIAVVGARKLDD
jgi:hypothetical protein